MQGLVSNVRRGGLATKLQASREPCRKGESLVLNSNLKAHGRRLTSIGHRESDHSSVKRSATRKTHLSASRLTTMAQ
jgi:glutamate 5-kinase